MRILDMGRVDVDDIARYRSDAMGVGGVTLATALGVHANAYDASKPMASMDVNVGPVSEQYVITQADVGPLVAAALCLVVAARGAQRRWNTWRATPTAEEPVAATQSATSSVLVCS